MTLPRGLMMKPTLKKRSRRSGCRALAWAITKALCSRAILPRASVSSPGMSSAPPRVEGRGPPPGEGDGPPGQVQARQPRRRLDEVGQVLEVDHDVLPLPDA